MASARFGTCSWKYDSWQGLVYTDQAKKNYLLEYSRKYNTVEIDQWFWSLFGKDNVSLPRREVVVEYTNSVPDDFKFTIKVPNSITLTHFYKKQKSDALEENPHFLSIGLFETFLSTLQTMHPKIGMIMFQFEYLNKQKMSSLQQFMERFGDFMQNCDRTFDYGVEIRNPNYLNNSYFDFLNQNKLGHVFCQGYYMPDIAQIYTTHWQRFNRTTAIRLMGPDRSDIEERSGGQWNRIYDAKDEEINRIAKVIEELQDKNLDIYVNVNNHYEGSAPLTIEKIKNVLFNK